MFVIMIIPLSVKLAVQTTDHAQSQLQGNLISIQGVSMISLVETGTRVILDYSSGLPPVQKSPGTSCCCLPPSTPPPTLGSYCNVQKTPVSCKNVTTELLGLFRFSD